jgi:hypothetical protein
LRTQRRERKQALEEEERERNERDEEGTGGCNKKRGREGLYVLPVLHPKSTRLMKKGRSGEKGATLAADWSAKSDGS